LGSYAQPIQRSKTELMVHHFMGDSTSLTYIGHATILIEMNGVRVLTDPLLRDRAGFLRRCGAPIDPKSYQDVDAILISHLHMDHMDPPSLRLMDHKTRLIVPRGAADILNKSGDWHINEFGVNDSIRIGSVSIRSTYAEHVHSRYPLGPVAECMGYVISGSHKIYFAGDTDLFPGMADIADDLDVALLPVWGWGPTIRGLHMNPYRAAQALTLLRPRVAIPIHWGTMAPLGLMWMKPPFLTQPPHDFAQYAVRLAPKVKVQILTPGSSLVMDGDSLDGS
jgi:L-ascorbate metabolism protein UlaG (beta-lactamase superfamily)